MNRNEICSLVWEEPAITCVPKYPASLTRDYRELVDVSLNNTFKTNPGRVPRRGSDGWLSSLALTSPVLPDNGQDKREEGHQCLTSPSKGEALLLKGLLVRGSRSPDVPFSPEKSSRCYFSLLPWSESSEQEGLFPRLGGWSRVLELRPCDLDPRVPLKSSGHQHRRGTCQPECTPALDKGEGWWPWRCISAKT